VIGAPYYLKFNVGAKVCVAIRCHQPLQAVNTIAEPLAARTNSEIGVASMISKSRPPSLFLEFYRST